VRMYRLFSFPALPLYSHMRVRSYLRGFAGPCSIELAYQAAEANHPD